MEEEIRDTINQLKSEGLYRYAKALEHDNSSLEEFLLILKHERSKIDKAIEITSKQIENSVK